MPFKLLIFLSLVLQATHVHAFAKKGSSLFDEFVIESPVSLTHPVMVVDLLSGSSKEIVTLGVDEHAERWLHVYKHDVASATYQIDASVRLPGAISRFDVSEFKDGDLQSIYFLSADSVYIYQPIEKTLRVVANVSSIFLDKQPEFISQGEFVFDINDDGMDELLLSDFQALHLLKANDEGRYVSYTLNEQPNMVLDHNGMRFLPKTYYVLDANNDGLEDIVIGGEGTLHAFYQTNAGNVNQSADEHPLVNDISAIAWWHKRDATGESLDQANLTYRQLEELQDVNGDGVADMVVRATQSSGVLDRVNDYEVYLGHWKNNHLAYHDKPSSVISADGTLSGFKLVDINNDNKLEVILAGFDIGLSQIIGALLSGSIDQDVYVFSMDSEGDYHEDASVEKEVQLSFSLTSGQTGSPVVKLADVNGDGLKDLILSSGEKRLKVYNGTSKKRMFDKRALKYKTVLPKNGNGVEVNDLNADGKDDLIFKYGLLDDKALAKTIRVLMSK